MHPLGWSNHRLITIGKKKSSENGRQGEHYWGHVDEIVRTDRELEDHLAEIKHERQKCCRPPLMTMRVVGMGEYKLLRQGNHTQLAYELATPQPCGESKQELGMGSSATFVIGVKEQSANLSTGIHETRSQRAEMSQPSHEYYSYQGFRHAEPEQLNHEGAELLLISAVR